MKFDGKLVLDSQLYAQAHFVLNFKVYPVPDAVSEPFWLPDDRRECIADAKFECGSSKFTMQEKGSHKITIPKYIFYGALATYDFNFIIE